MTDVFGRLLKACGAANDAELAQNIGIPRGTVSSWRVRGSVPPKVLLDAAKRSGYSLEWLVNGQGPEMATAIVTKPDPYQEYLCKNYDLILKVGILIGKDKKLKPWPENSLPVAIQTQYLLSIADGLDSFTGYICDDDFMEPTIRLGWPVIVGSKSSGDLEITERGIYKVDLPFKGVHKFCRVDIGPHTIRLRFDNGRYPPETIDLPPFPPDHDGSFVQEAEVSGRVIWAGGPI